MSSSQVQFVVPRDSRDEVTFAVIHARVSLKAQKKGMGINEFLDALKQAVTNWIKTTTEGRQAWENSSQDFNIGDLANENIGPINAYLKHHGIAIDDINVFSMDCSAGCWEFDTVLVKGDEL